MLPEDPYLQAKVDEWLFWEQYSHEPYIAVCRFHMLYQGKPREAREPGGWNAARMPWITWKIIFPAANGWRETHSLLLILHCWLTLGLRTRGVLIWKPVKMCSNGYRIVNDFYHYSGLSVTQMFTGTGV